MWLVYILECSDGSLYTGITNDLPRRLKEHVEGVGAKYTKSHPVKGCVYAEPASSRSEALKREASIKKLSKPQKLALVEKGRKIEK